MSCCHQTFQRSGDTPVLLKLIFLNFYLPLEKLHSVIKIRMAVNWCNSKVYTLFASKPSRREQVYISDCQFMNTHLIL